MLEKITFFSLKYKLIWKKLLLFSIDFRKFVEIYFTYFKFYLKLD